MKYILIRKVIHFSKYSDVNVCKIIHKSELKNVVEFGTGTKKCCKTCVISDFETGDECHDKDKRKRTKKIFIGSTDK